MNKKGKKEGGFSHLGTAYKVIKQSYLCRLITKFLSVACSIILVILLIVGSLMFYFNTKAASYEKNGMEYTVPFGLYTIISGSMEPNVEVYDVVIAADYDVSKIKVGDIITFVSNWDVNFGKTITHRVVEISKSETGEYQLTTKGDNNNIKDGGIVTQHNLVGKVVGRLPQLGRLQVFLATKMGWFMVVFVPALAIIIYDMIKVFKLFILKEQIDNVKTPKEALNEQKKSAENGLPKINKGNIMEDENVDTVELPKVLPNGKISENTGEMRVIKYEKMFTKNKSVGTGLPKVDNSMPLIRKKTDTEQQEVSRTKLKRRR